MSAPVLRDDFLALAKLALAGREQDIQLFLAKTSRRYRAADAGVAAELAELLTESSSRSSALRRESASPVPVDNDSRLHLIKIQHPSTFEEVPIFSPAVEAQISGIVRERENLHKLAAAGIAPTRTALFVGPPGVGKTLSARWIAYKLKLPLLILDLAAVMSSFLGRTGNNVRAVLDYAKKQDCVLLLDELDSIAKRRDDATEIGELKRLVTVLLQEIDDWPASGVLIAATNHPELLDPAVWRRFDNVIEFPKPDREFIAEAIKSFFGTDIELSQEWIDILSVVFAEQSYSDIQRSVTSIRRKLALDGLSIDKALELYAEGVVDSLAHSDRIALGERLQDLPEVSQRRAALIARVSRDTLRSRAREK